MAARIIPPSVMTLTASFESPVGGVAACINRFEELIAECPDYLTVDRTIEQEPIP